MDKKKMDTLSKFEKKLGKFLVENLETASHEFCIKAAIAVIFPSVLEIMSQNVLSCKATRENYKKIFIHVIDLHFNKIEKYEAERDT